MEECRNVRREEGNSTAPTLDSATYNLRSFRPVALVTRVPGLVEMRADLHYSTPLGIRARLLTQILAAPDLGIFPPLLLPAPRQVRGQTDTCVR